MSPLARKLLESYDVAVLERPEEARAFPAIPQHDADIKAVTAEVMAKTAKARALLARS